jgi:DNA polymerase III subunit alpha
LRPQWSLWRYAISGWRKSKGVQPIIGALLGVRRPTSDGKFIRDWLPLFAQDESGYDNLCRLVSMAHLDRPEDLDAHVALEQLAPFSDGLIALTGGAEGAVTQLLSDGQNNAAGNICPACRPCFRTGYILS